MILHVGKKTERGEFVGGALKILASDDVAGTQTDRRGNLLRGEFLRAGNFDSIQMGGAALRLLGLRGWYTGGERGSGSGTMLMRKK